MARIPTYQKDIYISDLDRIIGTDGDTNELVTKNFFLGDIAEYVIDKFIDPDAVSFQIPLFRDTQNTLSSNATRITGSIMTQDTYPDGSLITVSGQLQVSKEAKIRGRLVGGVAESGQLVLNSSLNATSITIKAPSHANLPFSYTWELPSVEGSPGDQLTTNGAGKLYWAQPEDDNLTVAGDGGQGTIDLDSQILNIVGGTNVSTTMLGQTLTINASGFVTGSGTQSTLPMWGATGQDLLDSFVSQGGSTVYIDSNVALGASSANTITTIGKLYLNSPVKDTTNTQGNENQILVSDAAGELTFTDLSDIATGSAEVIEVPVKNLQGSALTKGDPVYISGSVGTSGRLEVQLADASNAAKMPAVGLLKQDLGINEEGFVVVTGKLRNLDNGAIDGQTPAPNDVVYVKASGTTGNALTLVKPVGSALIQNMGKVGRVSNVGSNDGTFVVSSILRTNDIPNLTPGKIWVGSTGNTIESSSITFTESTGAVQLNSYGGGTFTGTATQTLAVDVNGNIIETPGVTVDGSGTANTIPLWTDSQVLADSILSQGTNPPNTGLVLDGDRIKVDGTTSVKDSLTINYTDGTFPRVFPSSGGDFDTLPTGRVGVINNDGALEWVFSAVSKGDPDYKRSGILHSKSNAYRLILNNITEESVYLNSEGDSFIKGNLAIGKDNPTYKLDVEGNVAVSGDIYTDRVRRANVASELRINQARFFDTGNIANKYGTDIGATLHLRTDSSAEDKDVIALTKEGEGTSVTSGIKQSTAGEYTLILRDASNNQRVNFTTIELGQSFIDNTRVILSGNTNNANGAITINGRKWSSGERNAFMKFNKSGTQLDTALEFYSGGVLKGSIAYDSTGTAYNVSSDYRLKENVVEITDGIERLKQLKPSRFNFISDADKVVDGFIAHEVQDIIPEAVTGEKDATEEYEVTPAEYDDYGNVVSEAVMGTRDAYQQIDQAKIVPLLTAALQEAVAKIESLEARIQTLEGN